jgi:aspartyl-tRNA(Asn)/glutamyl-tRNA(Gln) amidotransferase subunit A
VLNASLKELAAALAQRKISSAELTKLFLDRIARLNSALNAFITVDAEKSFAQARAADERIAKGAAQPLTGIPVAHKDIFVTKGWPTTCGSKILSNFIGPYDAHVIERFNTAGAVILGKTNMDEFAMGSSTENSFYGPVKNPWNPYCVPGGSSGGSAAAIAARMAPAATGTDTGGSIRQPAALSGASGLKPTYGLVSRFGMIAFASSLDQGGPLAKSAEDLALLLNVMAGFDKRDSTSVDHPAENYTRDLEKPLAGLRIGVPKEHFGLPPTWARRWRRRLRSLKSSAQNAFRSACPTAVFPCRRITSLRPPRPRRTCRASTACATAAAQRSTATSPICIAARAPKASAPKSGAASLSAPMSSLTATTTPTTSRRRRSGG